MKIRVILDWDEEAQAFSATCPELNFISSCGDTEEEAIKNFKEAINLMLEPIPDELIEVSQTGSHLKLFNPKTQRTAIVPIHQGKIIPIGTLKSIEKQSGITFN